MAVHPSAAVPIMRPHLPPLDQFAQLVAELFETRMLSNFGKYTGLLEERASGLLDHPSPLCVSSCDIGLTLAWQALECPPGEVIVPSFTFCSTVNALRWNGLEPVFADVDPETYCIDVEDVRRLITPRTVGIAAVHVFGLPAAIEPLEGLARARAEADLRRSSRAGREISGDGAGGVRRRLGVQPERHQARDRRRRRPRHLPRPGRRRAIHVLEGLRVQGRLQLPIRRPQRQALGAERGPGLALARLARGRPSPSSCPGRTVSRRLADCPGLSWQLVPPECMHGYKDLAVRFRKPEQRVAAEAALAAAGVMTKRYFFPVHRMEVYRSYEPLLACDRPSPRTSPMHPALPRSFRRSHRWHRRDDPPKPWPRVDAPLRGLRLARAGRARSRRGHRARLSGSIRC